MDRKFESDSSWFISPLVNLRQFLTEGLQANNSLTDAFGLFYDEDNEERKMEPQHNDEVIAKFMEMTQCTNATARNIFNEDLVIDDLMLKEGGIDPFSCHRDGPFLSDQLQTHAYLAENLQQFKNPQKKSNFMRTLKYDRYEDAEFGLKRPQAEWNAPCQEDIVIMVSCLPPHSRELSDEDKRLGRHMHPQFKFMLRGDTLLSDFRRKIPCVTDMNVAFEDGKELLPPNSSNADMVKYPSSFIFIHDTFYVDYTPENSTDVSANIRDFMGRKACFDPVYHKNIEGVRIIDLNLRLGQPYCYVHCGTCEHLLIFHDLRLLHKSDKQALSEYPICTFSKVQETKCEACKMNSATYAVVDGDRLPSTCVCFCDSCFEEYNFIHGRKIGRFTAYPLYRANCITFKDF